MQARVLMGRCWSKMKYNDNPAPSNWVDPSYKEGTLSQDLMLKGCVIN